VRVIARVVASYRLAAVAAHAQALARDRELPELGLDPAFADFLAPVVQGQDPGRYPGGSSPSLSNEAERMRFPPVGIGGDVSM
jgi:hypothetical protein